MTDDRPGTQWFAALDRLDEQLEQPRCGVVKTAAGAPCAAPATHWATPTGCHDDADGDYICAACIAAIVTLAAEGRWRCGTCRHPISAPRFTPLT